MYADENNIEEVIIIDKKKNMSNLKDKLTEEEWNALEESLIGKKHPFEKKEPIDPIVDKVLTKFKMRSELGITKYGTTLQDNNASLWEWLNHLQEELMDATLYVEKLKQNVK